VLAFLVLCQASTHSRTSVTPIQKVTQLLDGLLAKGKAEKHSEQVAFAEFKQWCDSVRAQKSNSIDEAGAQIMQLEADIQKAESDADGLASEIAELQAAIAQADKEAAEATAMRKKERADYATTHQDFSESVDAIQRAIAVLKSRAADVPQTLMQLRTSRALPLPARAAIDSFLGIKAEASGEASAPEANAYEFQSGGVIAILEKLRLKFQDERTALEKAEMNARSNYEMIMQQLTDNLEEDNKSESEKTAAKAGRLEDAGEAKGGLAATQTSKADDEAALSDTNGECTAKSTEFEQNQNTRSAEIEAITKAMEILSSDAIAGHGETYLPAAMLQAHATPARTVSLAQLRSAERENPEVRRKAASFLKSRAQTLGSQYLSLVAARAQEDPFTKVKQMIKELLVKLMEQANEEADHKAYCDTELATNKQTRENKATEVEEQTAQVEKLTADTAQLATEIQQLSDAIAEIKGQQAEATKLRVEEKAQNAQTVTDAKEAQVACEQAIKVLQDFYSSAGGASMLQTHQKNKEPYQGMQSSKGGILGMLEVILSDFARLEAGTSSEEDAGAAAYEKFMAEADQDAAVKGTEMHHKENKKREADEENRNVKKDLALTQEELDAALDYYAKLKPDCVDQGFSYERRVQMRKEEIQSLQEALKILDGEALA